MKDKLNEIKRLISNYYLREYYETLNNETMYDNIEDLGLAYTTTEDWEEDDIHEVQVSTNILNMSLQTYIDGQLLEIYKFPNYKDYKLFLENLDFDEMIRDAYDVYKSWKEMCA